jgi:hypothetical protein
VPQPLRPSRLRQKPPRKANEHGHQKDDSDEALQTLPRLPDASQVQEGWQVFGQSQVMATK